MVRKVKNTLAQDIANGILKSFERRPKHKRTKAQKIATAKNFKKLQKANKKALKLKKATKKASREKYGVGEIAGGSRPRRRRGSGSY